MDARLRAVCDMIVPEVREYSGLHEYDGMVQDLSPDGVRAALRRLGGDPLDDPHDEAHLSAFENALRFQFGELELHRRNPLVHLGNLDLSSYDREYAPAEERAAAKRRHLAGWPDAVDAAIAALDAVSAPVAEALLPAIKGLAAGLDAEAGETEAAALRAHERLVQHVARAAREGDPSPALGAANLARLMGVAEATEVDLGRLAERADAERDRIMAILTEACARLDPDRKPAELIPELLRDHPDIEGVLQEARQQTAEAIAFSRERQLAPYLDGECLVGPAPESRSWAMAMMCWSAPEEPDGPSWYYVTPPDPSWPAEEIEEWLSVFSRTTLPAITVHEVAPGHFAHGRALRRAATPVRRILHSMTFCEGWAHYVEEVCLEEGFRAGDPRFAVGFCVEALIRVTRLACAIGLHTGAMDVAEATQRFMRDAFLARKGAASEAQRGTFDPTYGRYTWGKLAILDLREQAKARWGAGFSLQRFHRAMLDLGSPPIGLLGTALERG
ncbi:DUF885 domain-containing protein [Carbonactinospora thermoautotrophica]|uniref:DUF885 domain-containing protein n=1 Tax=Carbonactinospora thermoautotrophica TaxID=1469144 RepID=A0A132N1M1_9ACTN|nr:DUF885 family protein [Carbonactinospora thermoautotrophica]KWX04041.1 hypothetical protein TH66_08825 [Carbonactinospora thermoautotrophica]MCX9191851.1 DUF885 domain-containing protein [Carbonactinospora thermoautotrophica]